MLYENILLHGYTVTPATTKKTLSFKGAQSCDCVKTVHNYSKSINVLQKNMLLFDVDDTFQFQSVLLSVLVTQMPTSHAHTLLPNKFPLLESSIQTGMAAPAGFSSSSFRALLLLVSHFLCFYLPRLSFPLSFCPLLLLLCHFLPLWSKKGGP